MNFERMLQIKTLNVSPRIKLESLPETLYALRMLEVQYISCP